MIEIEKEKAIRILKALVKKEDSILSTKYLNSHKKVAVIYGKYIIEIFGDEEKYIKYLDAKVPLSKKEYKELYAFFDEELKSRKEALVAKKFSELENDINK